MAIIEIEGLKEQQEKLRSLMTDSPGMDKRLRDAIRKILRTAQKTLQSQAASGLGMESDPRRAVRAVRASVYRRIFGGNLNILQKRSAGSSGNYEPPRKGLPSRGGNRMARSERTKQVMGYTGAKRGFILRFLNAGASDRKISSFRTDDHRGSVNRGSQGGDVNKYGNISNVNTGNRGSIPASNWFGGASLSAMNEVAAQVEEIIDKIINEEFK